MRALPLLHELSVQTPASPSFALPPLSPLSRAHAHGLHEALQQTDVRAAAAAAAAAADDDDNVDDEHGNDSNASPSRLIARLPYPDPIGSCFRFAWLSPLNGRCVKPQTLNPKPQTLNPKP